MGIETEIAWTDHTFNPWWGCVRVSEGCRFCYAESWDKRYGGKNWGPLAPRRFFGDKHWNEPLRWNRDAEIAGVQRRVFCASMADVFEDRRDLDTQRERLWMLIAATPHLDWQLLTKRPENIAKLYSYAFLDNPPGNVWLGTTAEDQQRANERTRELIKFPAAVRFLSCEPLLEAVNLHLPAPRDRERMCSHCTDTSQCDEYCTTKPTWTPAVDWVIVGGESGAGARPMRLKWARDLIEQCKAAGVAAFFKQAGTKPQRTNGDHFGGSTPGYPDGALVTLRVRGKGGDLAELPGAPWPREFPEVAR